MQLYDVFNGDADGLCALHQFRLYSPAEARLITGTKRDIRLLSKIESCSRCHISVFDISFDKNRADVLRLIDRGAEIEYFDHHHAGDIPDSPRLTTHIDPTPDRGTSHIVDRHIGGRFRAWAVVGTFGDNFDETAAALGAKIGLSQQELSTLRELGILLNYNGYGATTDDLFYKPDQLYLSMKPFENPFDFIEKEEIFNRLKEGYASDMTKAEALSPIFTQGASRVFILPAESWARRVSGVFANMIARENPDGAHAVLTGLEEGGYVVSVRAPLNDRRDAHTLCMKFPTGGGRAAAAGINHLPEDQTEKFIKEFARTYSSRQV